MNTPPPYVPGHGLLKGKSVLITAAAGAGIGFATAKRCLEEGARALVMTDIHERRLRLERRKILPGFPINGVRIWIGVRRQIDLCARDMQKTQWISIRQRMGFLRVDDVVRNSCDAGSGLGFRTQRTEGLERRHETRNYTFRVFTIPSQ